MKTTTTCYDRDGQLLDDGLVQWDINVKIQVDGADVASAPDFHFCQKGRDFAYVVPSTIRGSKLEASVPNILLQSHYPLIVFLYYRDTSGEHRSKYQLQIPITPREMPMEYAYVENIGYESWTQMTQEAKEIIDAKDELVKRANDASRALDGAISAAGRAENAETNAAKHEAAAKDSATKAAASEKNVSDNANKAKNSAEAAALSQKASAESEKNAKTYMDSSAEYAEKAGLSETAAKNAQVETEAARDEAELHRIGAEDAQRKAEDARDKAIDAMNASQTAQGETEKARDEANTARDESQAAEAEAKKHADAAKQSEDVVLQKAGEVEQNADEVTLMRDEVNDAKEETKTLHDEALTYKNDAEGSAASAAVSAESAKQYSGKPPKPDVQRNIWQTWNAEVGEYQDTDSPVFSLLQFSYPSVEAMEADLDNRQFGNLAIITTSVEEEENASLYIRTETEWHYLGDLSGVTGNGIKSWEQTGGNGAPGTFDTYTVTWTDGQSVSYKVYNGRDGQGAGDMTADVYDTKGRRLDIYDYVDDALKRMTATDDDNGNVTLSFGA